MDMLKLAHRQVYLIAALALEFVFPNITTAAEEFDVISHLVHSDAQDVWLIQRPNVKRRESPYPQITYREGDIVAIEAGGCVQTGGVGKTWKRYVSPQGPNSERLYHGLIRVPGRWQFKRLEEVVSPKRWIIPPSFGVDNSRERLLLWLGYEDDDYGDNGYWRHDDGTSNQCKGIGPAWVKVIISPSAGTTETQPSWPKLVLEKTSFVFPGDGKKNLNQAIGPFCCTGETATIETDAGMPVGYIYFYDFEDAININETKSAAKKIKLLVSGADDLTNPKDTQAQRAIVFVAGQAKNGERKTLVAGKLRFTAMLEEATIDQTVGARFDMQSVRITVNVEPLNR